MGLLRLWVISPFTTINLIMADDIGEGIHLCRRSWWQDQGRQNVKSPERVNLDRLIRSPSPRHLWGGGGHSFFFTFFCVIHGGLLGSCIPCSGTWLSDFLSYVMGEGLRKISTTLNSGLTCSFWLISCWCHPRMYVMGKGLGKIFTALRYFFFYSLQLTEKVYNSLLKTSKAGNLLHPSEVYARVFFFFVAITLKNFYYTKLWVTETVFGP